MRRVDKQTRHFLALKRRVDSIEEQNAGESQVVQAELFRDEIGVSDEFVTVVDGQVSVETIEAQNITENSADLVGELVALGNSSSADVGHEYREDNTTDPYTQTATTNLTSPQQFTFTVSGLDASTDYEFRALADGSDGSSDQGVLVTFSTEASAYPQVIDRFESQSLTPYVGDTGDFSFNSANTAPVGSFYASGWPYSSSYSLASEMIGSNPAINSGVGKGLDNYPSRGEETDVWFYTEDFTRNNFVWVFGVQDENDITNPGCYRIRANGQNGEISIEKYENDTFSTLVSGSFSPSSYSNEWLLFRTQWRDDETILVEWLDSSKTNITNVSTTDNTWDSGGIGFNWQCSETDSTTLNYIDEAVIRRQI